MTALDDILERTRVRIAQLHAERAASRLDDRARSAPPPLAFHAALRGPAPSLIAEIKRATPRVGPLNLGADAGALAALYASSGARAVSVLTEPHFFAGTLEDVAAARTAGIPVLRKDFVLDALQVIESRAAGADAVLVIVRIASERVGELVALTRSLGMDALVEVHDEADVEIAVDAGADLIGINNRDLETFEIDPSRTIDLLPRIPDAITVVALSGLATRTDLARLEAAGVHAFLVGEALMRSPNPAATIASLVGAP